MAMPNDEDDTPLDPAAERVRRKLVRFMVINLAILFAAVMAVVAALVYKGMRENREIAVPAANVVIPSETIRGEIAIPQGARVVSQSLSGMVLSVHVALADGSEAILVHDIASGRLIARLALMERGE